MERKRDDSAETNPATRIERMLGIFKRSNVPSAILEPEASTKPMLKWSIKPGGRYSLYGYAAEGVRLPSDPIVAEARADAALRAYFEKKNAGQAEQAD